MTTYSNIDMTVTKLGPSMPVGVSQYVSLQVVHVSGAHKVHSVSLEASLDNTNWIEMERIGGGNQGIINIPVMAIPFFRYTIDDAEPTASVCDIVMLMI